MECLPTPLAHTVSVLAESVRVSWSVYTSSEGTQDLVPCPSLALLFAACILPLPQVSASPSLLLLLASKVERLSQGDAFHLYLVGNLREVRWGEVSLTYGFEC